MYGMLLRLSLILTIVLCSNGQNQKSEINGTKSDHFIVTHFGWQSLSGFGIVGTALNSFLLYTFYGERKALATSVNAMICAETLHRMIYSTISVHWRTYNMVMENPLFHQYLGKQKVKVNLQM